MLEESEVDREVDCKPEAQCECSSAVELADARRRHQVFEVPPMCRCGAHRSMSTASTADVVGLRQGAQRLTRRPRHSTVSLRSLMQSTSLHPQEVDCAQNGTDYNQEKNMRQSELEKMRLGQSSKR